MSFLYFKQPDAMDCGPACLKMITSSYGKDYSVELLRDYCFTGREGVSLLGISKAAERLGFRTIGGRFTFKRLAEKALLPCIVHWNQDHFVVVYKIRKKRKGIYTIYVADPGKGLLKYNQDEFINHWISTRTNNEEKGIALLLEPTTLFYEKEGEGKKNQKTKLNSSPNIF